MCTKSKPILTLPISLYVGKDWPSNRFNFINVFFLKLISTVPCPTTLALVWMEVFMLTCRAVVNATVRGAITIRQHVMFWILAGNTTWLVWTEACLQWTSIVLTVRVLAPLVIPDHAARPTILVIALLATMAALPTTRTDSANARARAATRVHSVKCTIHASLLAVARSTIPDATTDLLRSALAHASAGACHTGRELIVMSPTPTTPWALDDKFIHQEFGY